AYRTTQASGQLASASVTVRVAPAVTMKVSPRTARAGTSIRVSARVAPASASKAVLLLASDGHGWKQAGKAKLQASGTARFTDKLPAGQVSLRAVVKPPLLNAGFDAAQSATVRVSGANSPAILQFEVTAEAAKGKHSTPRDEFSTRTLRAKPG